MKTTDSVMRELPRIVSSFLARLITKGEITPKSRTGWVEYQSPEIEAFFSHSLAEARREEREQRDNAWKKIIACHNCSGTGRTDNIGGAMECVECGGQCHNLVRHDGIHIDDLLTGDNPEEAK